MRTSLLLLVTACQLEAEPVAQPAPSLADRVLAVERRMHQRYAATSGITDAIARGDLDRERDAARIIARSQEPDALPEWQPYFEGVRLAAVQLEQAPTVVAAAKGTGELGHRCASCHEAANARIAFAAEPRPSGEPPTRMRVHEWAIARMWEGLIGPSDAQWLQGADALQQAPLTYVAESDAIGIADHAARVHLLADRARRPDADRAGVFGELLTTCVHCHATIRDR